MIQSVAILFASLCLSWTQPVTAGDGLDGLLDGLLEESSSEGGKELKLIAVAKNGRGTITYNGKRVWKGRVKNDPLTALGKVVSGKPLKYAEGTEVAAVWDGDKLLWENVSGAALELEPERRKLQQQAERLMDALKDLR